MAGTLRSLESRQVLDRASNVTFADGYLFSVLDEVLLAQRFDPGELRLQRKGRRGGLGPRDLALPIPGQLLVQRRAPGVPGGGPARGADRVVRSRLGRAIPRAGARRLLRDAAQSGRAAAARGEARWPNLSGAHLAVRPGRRRLEPAHAEVRGPVQLRLDARTAGRWRCSRRAATARNSCWWTAPRSRWSRRSPTTPRSWTGRPAGVSRSARRQVQETGFDLVRWSGVRTACPTRRFPPRRPTSLVRESRPTVGTWRTSRTRAAARRSTSRGCQGLPVSGRSHSRGPARVALHLPGAARGRCSISLAPGRAAVGSCSHRAGAAARQTEHGAGSTGQHQRDRSGAPPAAAAAVLRPVNRCAAYLGGELDGTSWSPLNRHRSPHLSSA